MKFLRVFCVVLCVHTGVTTPNKNNVQEVLNESITSANNIDIPMKYVGALDNQYNSIETANSQNWQRSKDSQRRPRQKSSKDPFLRSGDRILEAQGLSSKSTEKERKIFTVENPAETISSHTLLPDSGRSIHFQNEGLINRTFNQPAEGRNDEKKVLIHNEPNSDIQNTKLPNTINDHKYLNSDSKVINTYKIQPTIKTPLTEEQMTLNSRGISLDKVKSLITTPSSIRSPSEGQLPPIINSNLDKGTSKSDDLEYFDDSVRYIMNRAKNLQDIQSSAKKLKRYMILHPDGTVEHVNELDTVVKRYPNYIAVNSKDLGKYATNIPKSQTSLRKESVNKGALPIASNNENLNGIKSNKSAELSNLSQVKATSSTSLNQVDLNKTKFSHSNNLVDDVKNLNESVLNLSNVKSSVSETTPLQNSTKIIPTQTLPPQDEHLKSNATVSSDSKKNLSEKHNNDKKSPFTWLPLNVHENKTDNLNLTSSSLSPPTPNVENIDHSGLWFQDRDFWDKVHNDTHNVFYFLFAPAAPNFKNETKTTIYANGTTVEETINVVDDEDGFPVASKTTKITHAEASGEHVS